MNHRLDSLLKVYAELEHGVQELVNEQCGAICGLCTTACCCRADLCEEAVASPFLRLLHNRNDLESDRYGFLTESGCSLPAGRPPVCYEFFCEEVLAAQSDDEHAHLLRILGALPMHAGQNAADSAHLAEINCEADLERIDFQTLENQMQESFQCLDILRNFFTNGALPEQAGPVLNRIQLPD